MTDITNVLHFIPEKLRTQELFVKISEMMSFVLQTTNDEMKDVKSKFTNPDELSEDAIKEILKEQGQDYIVGVMNTIEGFEFNTLVYFLDMVQQLKGTRAGLELVLKLLGFDSIIKEWWEDPFADKEPMTYEIIVVVNSSLVPDIFSTLEQVKVFSENYVNAYISNIDVRFSADKFAERAAIMGGFAHPTYRGRIIARAYS